MSSVKEFKFKSRVVFEDDIQETNFTTKGYIDEERNIIYFKHENNSYKFILKNPLEVFFNESKYIFDLNKKTLAIINSDNYLFNTSVFTSFLEVSNNEIQIKYAMDFGSFKGNYSISLEWH